jgi:hypothetical protein
LTCCFRSPKPQSRFSFSLSGTTSWMRGVLPPHLSTGQVSRRFKLRYCH